MEKRKIESLDEAIDELLSLGYLQYVEPDKLLEVTEADRRIELYDEEDRLERERDAFLEDIDSRLTLRPPQKESLERFARIVYILSLSKTPNLDAELASIRDLFPTLSSFERDFPSICFALATGRIK